MKVDNIFALASQHNKWLAIRQATLSSNIANTNTPGFKALDIEPFSSVLEDTRVRMAITSPSHISGAPTSASTSEVENDNAWNVVHSGNSVSLEQEMLKAGDVNRAYAMNANVVKTFHRMLLLSGKG